MISRAVYNMLIAAVPAGRIYELRAPQGVTIPVIVYNRGQETRWRHVNGPTGMAQDTFQIDVYAATSDAADTLADTIEDYLDGFSGLVYYGADSPKDSVRIAGVSMQNGESLIDQTVEPFLYRVSRDYLITYERA